jgi:hypothetical protein
MSAAYLRWIGLALALVGVAGLVFSSVEMARRLSARDLPIIWFNKPVPEPRFTFMGSKGEVRAADPAPDDPDQLPRLRITYRGAEVSFPIEEGMRDDPRLPGLLRHEDWLRVLIFAEGARSEAELDQALVTGEIIPRLVVAMRLPAPGYRAGSWGDVRRREWRYRFVELLPEAVSDEPFAVHESTYAELDRLGDPVYRRLHGLEADLWKYQVMMHVTPSTLYRAKNKPVEDGMKAMAWTWPAAGMSVMSIVAGLALWFGAGSGRYE